MLDRKFYFVALLGSLPRRVAPATDGQIGNVALGGAFAPYLQFGGNFGFAVFYGTVALGFDGDSREACIGVIGVVQGYIANAGAFVAAESAREFAVAASGKCACG